MDDITDRMSSKMRNSAKMYRINWFWARRYEEIKIAVSTETPKRLERLVWVKRNHYANMTFGECSENGEIMKWAKQSN